MRDRVAGGVNQAAEAGGKLLELLPAARLRAAHVFRGAHGPAAFQHLSQEGEQFETRIARRRFPDAVTDQSNFAIAAGTVTEIAKQAKVTGSATFLQTPLPYSLD